jgi:uncharacterized repeat protein (TIGR01451 family)
MYNRSNRNVYLNRLNLVRKFNFRQLIIYVSLALPALFANTFSVLALPVPNFCFAFADDGDRLHTMLFDGTAQQAAPNDAGVINIEAMAFNPANEILYAINANQFGTLNYNFADAANGGVFTPLGGGFGTINGAAGTVPITDVDSMAFDPITNILYAVDRDAGTPDRLFIINIVTGAADPNGFGAGIGYIEVTDNNAATVWDEDIDDLAIDPSDAQLYAVANSGGAGDHLIILDRNTGALSDIGLLTTDDMEGLGFFNDGTLYGTTGAASSTPADRNVLWRINTSNANAARVADFVSDGDYEAVACLVGDPNNKSGVVFSDTNSNGTLDAGESPVAGVTIEIYRDSGIVAGAIDASDRRIGTAITNASGSYQFDMASIGEFLLQVDITSLPAGISISDNIEIATFNSCNPGAAPFDDFGCNEPDNNFPSNSASVATATPTSTPTSTPVIPATPAPTSSPNTAPPANAGQAGSRVQVNGASIDIRKTVNPESVQVGETVTFTITITNPDAQAISDVTVTDNVPEVFSIIEVTTTQGVVTINGNQVNINIGTLQPQQTVTVIINTESIAVSFPPDTCNQVNIDNGVSNQACPNIFPGELPQTGQSPFGTLRLIVLVLATMLVIGMLIRFRMTRKF